MKTKLTFEQLPDGTLVITAKGKNIHRETYLRQEVIKESSIFDAIKECYEYASQFNHPSDAEIYAKAQDEYKYVDSHSGRVDAFIAGAKWVLSKQPKQEEKKETCPLCQGRGIYYIGGSFGGAQEMVICHCKTNK